MRSGTRCGCAAIGWARCVKTSSDSRHKPGVERFWEACAERDDFYRKFYAGFHCNEVLSFIDAGLADFSAWWSMTRARGRGIPVPGDPDQVIYVWFDELINYITGPGYGTDGETFRYWWDDAETRVHVSGKGTIRFHAVY